MLEQSPEKLQGLTSSQAKKLQEKYGKNELVAGKKKSFLHEILHVVTEPMFLLLIVAAVIYFILGEPRDGHDSGRISGDTNSIFINGRLETGKKTLAN